ncbi:hypothetical protein MYCTH_2296969 [Thermothelomyces thermophilus ATCC 42464]|uniref:Uncharacterized protein n=1 Tax=Thermothelomyces thermophilus (strain ATCC 42464 / BCRC 31852 / DSM 1799) TaxID=573729 RepID=G2Q3R3_THET4|nr:uncharacterized protein MYCTH_2296969 [Thermothelomyces thermophilus ATCC 42464]AEO54416.1 hypothetical protein MYCTH_2296969 [Thermothelomyces thermophilus ATCC 42464]
MPIRNPFARRAGTAAAVQDENQRPGSAAGTITAADAAPTAGFERVDTVGSKASSAFSIRSGRRSYDTGEYKMSVVNDSGVYLPPSPVEREASWPRRYLSRTSSGRSSSLAHRDSGEIDQFPISRESFDSYRRSFDICARSPVVHPITTNAPVTARQSLDSATLRPACFPPRSPLSGQQQHQQHARRWRGPPTPEESATVAGGSDGARFEDVGLGDQNGRTGGGERGSSFFFFSHDRDASGTPQVPQAPESQPHQAPQARKRGFFFGKFGGGGGGGGGGVGENGADAPADGGSTGTVVSRLLPGLVGGGGGGGRKRAQSGGQGAELGVMPAASRLDGPAAAITAPPGLEGMQAKEVEV